MHRRPTIDFIFLELNVASSESLPTHLGYRPLVNDDISDNTTKASINMLTGIKIN